MKNMEENCEIIWKIQKKLVKRYGNYERKISWIVKRFGKYRKYVSWILKRYEKFGRKVG